MRSEGRILVIVALLILSTSQAATSNLRLTIEDLFVSGSAVQLRLSLTNTENIGVVGLDESNFFLDTQSDSFPVIQPTVTQPDQGIALVICLDVSGSMPLDQVKRVLRGYLSTLNREDRVAVVTFGAEVVLLSAFSNDFSSLAFQIDSLVCTNDMTELYKGIYEGLALLRDHTPDGISRRFLLVMSDGRNEYASTPTYELNHCVELAREIGVPIMSIGHTGTNEEIYLQSLINMSDRTGGSYLRAITAANMGSRIQETLRILDSQYQVEFEIPLDIMDSLEHSYVLTVTTDSASISSEFTLIGESEIIVEKSRNIPMNQVIIVFTSLTIILVIAILYRKSAKRKIDILNEELLNSKGILSEMKIKKEAAEVRALESQTKALDKSATVEPKLSKKRFRETMISESLSGYSKCFLQVLTGADNGQVFTISQPVTTIGHADDNLISLEVNIDSTVSRYHAVVRYALGQVHLEDRGSRNGTFLNGKRIETSRLNNGDIIRLGKVELIFKGE